MKNFVIVLAVLGAIATAAFAQTDPEVPQENQQVVEPPASEQKISPDAESPLEQTETEAMTLERMTEIVRALDENAEIVNNQMRLTIADVPLFVVSDVERNRMRAFVPFKTLDGVDGQMLYRMMQANFDSALDARYAIADGHLISVFIHPLAELEKTQFIEGLGQVVNLVKTFGTLYSSGAITFGGGDSRNLHRQLIDELLQKGEEI